MVRWQLVCPWVIGNSTESPRQFAVPKKKKPWWANGALPSNLSRDWSQDLPCAASWIFFMGTSITCSKTFKVALEVDPLKTQELSGHSRSNVNPDRLLVYGGIPTPIEIYHQFWGSPEFIKFIKFINQKFFIHGWHCHICGTTPSGPVCHRVAPEKGPSSPPKRPSIRAMYSLWTRWEPEHQAPTDCFRNKISRNLTLKRLGI